MDKTERESRILRERRLELGLSQTEVALNAGLQLQHYQRYEYGDRKLSNSSMILGLRICSILDTVYLNRVKVFNISPVMTVVYKILCITELQYPCYSLLRCHLSLLAAVR